MKIGTAEEYAKLADAILKANTVGMLMIAREKFFEHPLNITDPETLTKLAQLLANLQKASFMHGVVATLYAIDGAGEEGQP